MRGLIDHGLAGPYLLNNDPAKSEDVTYQIYFGLGHSLSLTHSPSVFNVSLAGIKLGHYLLQSFDPKMANSSFLDIGTGSGVHALLMRKLGIKDIAATDISEPSIEQAKQHERINFEQSNISFHVSNLFEGLSERQFQTIVFNPPGWRTPSHSLIQRLKPTEQAENLSLNAMFYGEEVIARFLEDLPKHLAPTGRAIVGLNSLVGISDVLHSYNQQHNGNPPLSYRLLERHTLPLLYYSAPWRVLSAHLKFEFENLSAQGLAAYSTDQHGNIYWSYEIIEFFHCAL